MSKLIILTPHPIKKGTIKEFIVINDGLNDIKLIYK